jgi:acetyl-CoA acyltransferase 1
MDRLRDVLRHLQAAHESPSQDSALSTLECASAASLAPNDVVIVSAVRTPIARAKNGGYNGVPADHLLTTALQGVLAKSGVDPKEIGDVVVGNVLADQSAFMARIGCLLAGLPESVPTASVNRQCSSGLQAVMTVANAIRSGQYEIGIGAGVEMMSAKGMNDAAPQINPKIFDNQAAKDCLVPMGVTSENVAERYGVTREEQDSMAVNSHQKAAKAQANGWYKDEIVPVTVTLLDESGTEIGTKVVSADEGIRGDVSTESLGKLKPAFKKGGTTTAGNSSQVSDGAAAVLLASYAAAKKRGLHIEAVIRSYAVVGVAPDVMGIGPAVAIPQALKQAGLSVKDIDIFEINEAFASQATYCVKTLGIPLAKLNPKGGAIALGHPLGCTGARQIATLLPELKRQNGRYGVVSMCIGTGMGAAAVIERVSP